MRPTARRRRAAWRKNEYATPSGQNGNQHDAPYRRHPSAYHLFHDNDDIQGGAGISLDLPGSKTAQSVSSSALSVVVMSENEIYVDKTRTNLQDLSNVLRQRVSGSDSSQVRAVLEGRASASYQLIVSVLNAFRMNGVENVGLITRKDKAVR